MKVIKALLLILLLFVITGGTWFYLEHSLPSENTVKQEFLKRNSDLDNVEIVSIELIFDHSPKDVLTYLVKYKEANRDEIKIHDFAIQQNWKFQWHWCSDQTERKCD